MFMSLVRRRGVVGSRWLHRSSGGVESLSSLSSLDRLGSVHRSLVQLGGRAVEGRRLVTVVADVGGGHGRGNVVGRSGRLVDARVGRVPLLDLSGGCGVDGGGDLADGAVCDLRRAGSNSEVLGSVKSGSHVTGTGTIGSSRSGDDLSLGDRADSGRERDGLGDNMRTFGAVGGTRSTGSDGSDSGGVDGRGGVAGCHNVLGRNWVRRLVTASRLGGSRLLRLIRLARLSGLLRLRRLGRGRLFLSDRAHGSGDSNGLGDNMGTFGAVGSTRSAGSDSSDTGSIDS